MPFDKRNSEDEEGKEEKERKKEISLDWKDYITITIAMLESNMLPLILLIVVLMVIAILFLIL